MVSSASLILSPEIDTVVNLFKGMHHNCHLPSFRSEEYQYHENSKVVQHTSKRADSDIEIVFEKFFEDLFETFLIEILLQNYF